MNIQIRNNIGLPIYLQIVERIRYLIFIGEIGEGDSLPSARALAEQLGINLNTVNRAYRQLQVDGLIESKPGRGARVLSRGGAPVEPARAASASPAAGGVDEMLSVALERALAAGLSVEQIEARVDALLGSMAGDRAPGLVATVYAGPEWRSRRLADRLAKLLGAHPRVRIRPALEGRAPGDATSRSKLEIDVVVAFGAAGEELVVAREEGRLSLPVHLDRDSVRSLLMLPPGIVPTVVAGDGDAGKWLVDTVSPLLGSGGIPTLAIATALSPLETPQSGYYVLEGGLPGSEGLLRQFPDRCVVAELTFSQASVERLLAAIAH